VDFMLLSAAGTLMLASPTAMVLVSASTPVLAPTAGIAVDVETELKGASKFSMVVSFVLVPAAMVRVRTELAGASMLTPTTALVCVKTGFKGASRFSVVLSFVLVSAIVVSVVDLMLLSVAGALTLAPTAAMLLVSARAPVIAPTAGIAVVVETELNGASRFSVVVGIVLGTASMFCVRTELDGASRFSDGTSMLAPSAVIVCVGAGVKGESRFSVVLSFVLVSVLMVCVVDFMLSSAAGRLVLVPTAALVSLGVALCDAKRLTVDLVVDVATGFALASSVTEIGLEDSLVLVK
jgi:hypothetical protein